MAPEVLSNDVIELYEQLQSIPDFENEFCRKSFPGFLDKMRRIRDFYQVQNYRVVFIGEPGKGKTTAICNWLGLLREDKIKAERIDKVSLLATASGRTTVAEVRIKQVEGNSCLRLEYMPIKQQQEYVREYANYYYKKCLGLQEESGQAEETDSTKDDTHIEMDRVVKNMAGLQNIPNPTSDRLKAKLDSIIAFVNSFDGPDAFYKHLLEIINLPERQLSVIEKGPDEDFEDWLSTTFRNVNDGKHPECSIANVIHVDVSIDDHDLMLPSMVEEVIDTKGLDSAAAARLDLQSLMCAEDTICFLMDDVKSVPSDNVRNLLKRAYLVPETDNYYKCKTSIFVRASEDELARVNEADDDPEYGRELKLGEIDRRVDTDNIPYLVQNTVFLDACAAFRMKDSREPVLDSKGQPIINPRTNRPKYRPTKIIGIYDEDTADEYRCELTAEITTRIDRFMNLLEADAREIHDGVAELLEIERRTLASATREELKKAKETIERNKGNFLDRFHGREVSEAILSQAIDRIHWRTIRKMNSLYGAYGMWHTDIYTQIMQAGRELFADLMRPLSNFIFRTLTQIEDAEAWSIALGYLNQYETNVKGSTEDMGVFFLEWALEKGFAPQDDSNPFWNEVNAMRGTGYKRAVRGAYKRNIEGYVWDLADAIKAEANKDVDELLELLSEEL